MPGDAAFALGSAVVGALVGGAISGVVARVTLGTSLRLEREERQRREHDSGAAQVAAALTRCVQQLPVVVSEGCAPLLGTLHELEVLLVLTAPSLLDPQLRRYLRTAHGMLAADPAMLAHLQGLNTDARARVFSRFDVDRRHYVTWVVDLLADSAAGKHVPQNVPGPATLDDQWADPWSRPGEITT